MHLHNSTSGTTNKSDPGSVGIFPGKADPARSEDADTRFGFNTTRSIGAWCLASTLQPCSSNSDNLDYSATTLIIFSQRWNMMYGRIHDWYK